MPTMSGQLFGALGAKSNYIWTALVLYGLVYAGVDLFQSIKPYLVTRLSLLLRHHRTVKVLTAHNSSISNVHQRIQEDIKLSYLNRITVWAEYFISSIILVQLIFLNVSHIYLILCAIIYAGVSILVSRLFNKPLTNTELEMQQSEATLRDHVLTPSGLDWLIAANSQSLRVAKIRSVYLLFTKLQLILVSLLPFIVLTPMLLKGMITLGVVMEYDATFSLIVINASILIEMYVTLIQGKASEARVKEIES